MDTLKFLSKPSVQQFITDHENEDPFQLALSYKEVEGVPIQLIAQQIDQRKRAKKKLPEWHGKSGVIFPAKVSLEQSSSEITAKYKASLVSGHTMADLTGGIGIDTYYLSKKFERSDYVEQNSHLCPYARCNFQALGSESITVHHCRAEEYVNMLSEDLDLIYLDPARRDGENKKVVRLQDCEPNAIDLLPALLKRAGQIILKTSPLLDIGLSVQQLSQVSEIHVVSVNNECKEVLYIIGVSSQLEIYTINFPVNGEVQEFSFSRDDEVSEKSNLGRPKRYLYEPNASIMKAGAFKTIGSFYSLDKLHQHTHLYTSDSLIQHFPGRTFEIMGLTSYNKKEILKHIPNNKANITIRNFPSTVKDIRKKTGLQEGGEVYIFAFKNVDESLQIAICNKIKQ